MGTQATELMLAFNSDEEIDPKFLEQMTYHLRQELLKLDVDDVELIPVGGVPPDSKGVELIGLGALLVTLSAPGGLLITLINALKDWLTGQEVSSVTLEIDGDKLVVTGNPSPKQQQLIDLWVSRHRGFVMPGER